jgi:thiol-disulfide isomerase/thioredoxin
LAAPAVKPVRDNGIVDRKQAGLLAPDAPFLDSEGEAVTLADFNGGPVLLNLWATWCAPCVAEMPTLDALAAREAGKLSVITLSEDSDDDGHTAAEKIDAFFNRMKFGQLGAYLDADSAVMTQLGVSVLPTTILYDAAGKEVWRVTGELDWTGARAAGLLREGGAARR